MKKNLYVFTVVIFLIGITSCNFRSKSESNDVAETEFFSYITMPDIVPDTFLHHILVDYFNSKETTDETFDLYGILTEVMEFIFSNLQHKGQWSFSEHAFEYHSIVYSYALNKNFLFVYEIESGGSGSSYQGVTTYIFDIDSLKLIKANEILIDTANSNFYELVVLHLSQLPNYEGIEQESLSRALSNGDFTLFYNQDGVGLMFGKYSIASGAFGAFEVVLPYSDVQDFLTPTGKEVFN